MIGRLVKKQDFGVSREELSQSDAHLPTTGILGGRALHIVLAKTQAEQNGPNARMKRVPAHGLV